jgi:hypothetical protein
MILNPTFSFIANSEIINLYEQTVRKSASYLSETSIDYLPESDLKRWNKKDLVRYFIVRDFKSWVQKYCPNEFNHICATWIDDEESR